MLVIFFYGECYQQMPCLACLAGKIGTKHFCKKNILGKIWSPRSFPQGEEMDSKRCDSFLLTCVRILVLFLLCPALFFHWCLAQSKKWVLKMLVSSTSEVFTPESRSCQKKSRFQTIPFHYKWPLTLLCHVSLLLWSSYKWIPWHIATKQLTSPSNKYTANQPNSETKQTTLLSFCSRSHLSWSKSLRPECPNSVTTMLENKPWRLLCQITSLYVSFTFYLSQLTSLTSLFYFLIYLYESTNHSFPFHLKICTVLLYFVYNFTALTRTTIMVQPI